MAKINPLADWTQNMVWVHIGCTGQKASSNLPSEPGRPYYFISRTAIPNLYQGQRMLCRYFNR
jgi:hypothetical protein